MANAFQEHFMRLYYEMRDIHLKYGAYRSLKFDEFECMRKFYHYVKSTEATSQWFDSICKDYVGNLFCNSIEALLNTKKIVKSDQSVVYRRMMTVRGERIREFNNPLKQLNLRGPKKSTERFPAS